jgi:hypothetical protein
MLLSQSRRVLVLFIPVCSLSHYQKVPQLTGTSQLQMCLFQLFFPHTSSGGGEANLTYTHFAPGELEQG